MGSMTLKSVRVYFFTDVPHPDNFQYCFFIEVNVLMFYVTAIIGRKIFSLSRDCVSYS